MSNGLKVDGFKLTLNTCPDFVAEQAAPNLPQCSGLEAGTPLRLGLNPAYLGLEYQSVTSDEPVERGENGDTTHRRRSSLHVPALFTQSLRTPREGSGLWAHMGSGFRLELPLSDGTGTVHAIATEEVGFGGRSFRFGVRNLHASDISTPLAPTGWHLELGLSLTFFDRQPQRNSDLDEIKENRDKKQAEIDHLPSQDLERKNWKLAAAGINQGKTLPDLLTDTGDFLLLEKMIREGWIDPRLDEEVAALDDNPNPQRLVLLDALQGKLAAVKDKPIFKALLKDREVGELFREILEKIDRNEFRDQRRNLTEKLDEASAISDREYEVALRRLTEEKKELDLQVSETETTIREGEGYYHLATILTRSLQLIPVNRTAAEAFAIEGTRSKGRMLILSVNPFYDIPILWSARELAKNAPPPLAWGGLGLTALISGLTLYKGIAEDNPGSLSMGMTTAVAVTQALPSLVLRGGDPSKVKAGASPTVVQTVLLGVTEVVLGGLAINDLTRGDEARGWRFASLAANAGAAFVLELMFDESTGKVQLRKKEAKPTEPAAAGGNS